MAKILVSGGLGFIGSHLVHSLLQDEEAEVWAVDNLLNQVLPVEEVCEQITAGVPGKLHAVEMDIVDFRPDVKFDVIYHLASVVGPAAVLKFAGRISELIVRSTYHVIDLAIEHDARLVNVSTSEIYGGGNAGYCTEETPRIVMAKSTARLEYAVAKMAAEVALENLVSERKIDAATIRPFNVAGVRQSGRGGFVIPRFVGQAILGQPLTIFGDGTQLRAFTDARDVGAALELVAAQGVAGTAYNVGNPANKISIGELAQCVLRVTGSQVAAVHVDPRQIYGRYYAEAADKFPDSSRITELGWRPQYSLEDTVEAVTQWLRPLPPERIAYIAGL